MKRQLVSTASCVLLLCVCLPISAFASINITSAQTYALVSNYNSYYDYSYALAGATTTVIIPGSPDFSATNSTLYGQSGFSHDTELEREGGEYDASEGYGLVKFTAVTNDSYSISGNFENSAGWRVSPRPYDVTDNHLLCNCVSSSQLLFDISNGRGLNSSASNLQPSRPAPGLPGFPTWQCPETWGLAFC